MSSNIRPTVAFSQVTIPFPTNEQRTACLEILERTNSLGQRMFSTYAIVEVNRNTLEALNKHTFVREVQALPPDFKLPTPTFYEVDAQSLPFKELSKEFEKVGVYYFEQLAGKATYLVYLKPEQVSKVQHLSFVKHLQIHQKVYQYKEIATLMKKQAVLVVEILFALEELTTLRNFVTKFKPKGYELHFPSISIKEIQDSRLISFDENMLPNVAPTYKKETCTPTFMFCNIMSSDSNVFEFLDILAKQPFIRSIAPHEKQ